MRAAKLIVSRRVGRHCGGLVRHRVPLRRQSSPFLFGDLVGCVFSLLLTPDCFQEIFRRQVEFRDALICGHSATPYLGGSATLSVTGNARVLSSAVITQLISLDTGPLFRFAHTTALERTRYEPLSSDSSCGLSCKTALNSELWTSMCPL
jgi:hypothetical protein